jgi:four helix bundle protein
MSQSNYRDLVVWQKARQLAGDVYRITSQFPRAEQFGIAQQMRRAAVSILSNIAEGCGRWTRADEAHFLVIARGSALELEAQIVISGDVDLLNEGAPADLNERTIEVARMLNGLLRHLRGT